MSKKEKPPTYPSACPQWGRKMQPDLIRKDGGGVNSSNVSPVPAGQIHGYGYYCPHCRQGWTGDDRLRMVHLPRPEDRKQV